MADGITAASTVLLDNEGAHGETFRRYFSVIPFKFIWIDASAVDQLEATADATIEGAALGDFVLVAPVLDLADLSFNCYVTAANVVTFQVYNMTGGDLTTFQTAGATINGVILKPNADIWSSLT